MLDAGLVITNGWHHWIWVDFIPGPPGSNLLFYQHGLVYHFSVAYQTLLIALAIFILCWEAIGSRAWERQRAVTMGISLLMPLVAGLVYVIWSDQTLGLYLMPIGLSVGVLLISWIAFEDLRACVVDRTAGLEDTARTLQVEIEKQQQLEENLRRTQNSLAARLADQSHNLTGLYNLILMASQSLETQALLEQALDRIRRMLNSHAACFFRMEHDLLQLEAQQGLSASGRMTLQSLSTDWLTIGEDVRVDINTANAFDLPRAIVQAGFGACLFKSLRLPDRWPGVLAAFWCAPRDFAVEDIALFGALADGLGVILENSRLRKSVADAAIKQERRRLARDLHDSVTQSLYSLVLSAKTASHLRKSQPDRLEKLLLHLVESAYQALKEMRLLVYELGQTSMEETDLAQALQTRLDAVERRAGVDVRMVVENGASCPKFWEAELYHLAVEALNNTLKHARASRVTLRLRGQARNFEMHITDDGCGFDPRNESCQSGGMGLHNMAERAERLGGWFEVDSEIGKGTRVSFFGAPPALANVAVSEDE